MMEAATHLCVALQISFLLCAKQCGAKHRSAKLGGWYNSMVEKGVLQIKSVLYGSTPALQPAPSTSLLTCCLDGHRFPEVPARCLKTEEKPKQIKPDVAGCFYLQVELSSSRLVPS